jgi:hypothetical protein
MLLFPHAVQALRTFHRLGIEKSLEQLRSAVAL